MMILQNMRMVGGKYKNDRNTRQNEIPLTIT